MHELSIAHAVVSTVREALPGRTVLRVQVRVGMLAGVVPEALTFAWDVATSGTALAGSVLQVRREPLPGRCVDCAAASLHDCPPPLTCPQCGGRVLPDDATAARAMEVVSVEVDDETPSPATSSAATSSAATSSGATSSGGAEREVRGVPAPAGERSRG